MTLVRQMAVSFIALGLLTVAVGTAMQIKLSRVGPLSDAHRQDALIRSTVRAIVQDLQDQMLDEKNLILTGSSDFIQSHLQTDVAVEANLRILAELVADRPDVKTAFDELRATLDDLHSGSNQVVEAIKQKDVARATQISVKANRELHVKLESVAGDLGQEPAVRGLQLIDTVSNVQYLALGVLMLLFAGGVVALWASRGVARKLRGAISHLGSAAAEIAAAAEQHDRTSAHQSAAVSETTSTVEELRRTSKQIAGSSEEVVHAVAHSTEVVEGGVAVVSERTTALTQKTQEIGKIVTVIKDITEQINLLALNASIEAARAGDQGRAFGVVALEVRKLAERSSRSAEDITSIVEDIQSLTNTTVSATGQTFRDIQRLVDESADAVKKIAFSMQQQDSAIEQINEAMSDINAGTKETGAGIKQTRAAADEMNGLARELKKLVG